MSAHSAQSVLIALSLDHLGMLHACVLAQPIHVVLHQQTFSFTANMTSMIRRVTVLPVHTVVYLKCRNVCFDYFLVLTLHAIFV